MNMSASMAASTSSAVTAQINTSLFEEEMNLTCGDLPQMHPYKELCEPVNQFNYFRVIVDVWLTTVLILVGLLGNTTALLVLGAEQGQKTVSFLLRVLAAADNLYLVSVFFMFTLDCVAECTTWWPALTQFYPYVEPYALAVGSTVQTYTVWLVVLITFDRYIAVCHPFRAGNLCTQTTIKVILVVLASVAVLYNIPRFFEYTITEQCHVCTGVVQPVKVKTALRDSDVYYAVYKTGLYLAFRVFAPLISLGVINGRLICVLRSASRRHAALTQTEQKKDSFTLILVVIVTVFILCYLPDAVIRTIITLDRYTSLSLLHQQTYAKSYAVSVSNLLFVVNASVNCLLYCVTGKRFRRLLVAWCMTRRTAQVTTTRQSFGRGSSFRTSDTRLSLLRRGTKRPLLDSSVACTSTKETHL